MVGVQRRVAATEETVGRDALRVAIPRVQAGPIALVSNLGGPDIVATDSSAFTFFDSNGWKFEQFGPNIAGGGFAQKNLIGKADPDNPDNQTVGFTVLKVPPWWGTDGH